MLADLAGPIGGGRPLEGRPPTRLLGQVCGNELIGQIVAPIQGGGFGRVRFAARR